MARVLAKEVPSRIPIVIASHDRQFLDACTTNTLFLRLSGVGSIPDPYTRTRQLLADDAAVSPTQGCAGAASGSAIDLRQNPQLILHRERPAARLVRKFGSCRRWGRHGGRPPASHRQPERHHVSVRQNHMISALRPEAKLFGLRCLMIIGTEGNSIPRGGPTQPRRLNSGLTVQSPLDRIATRMSSSLFE